MNGNPHDQHEKQHETPDRRHEQSEPVEKTGTPDAVEAAHVRRDGDLGTPIARRRARGVEWVRPTDLIARHSASLSGRGIDFEAELPAAPAPRSRTGCTTSPTGRAGCRRCPPSAAAVLLTSLRCARVSG